MDLNLFKVFDTIYRAGSLTEAARDLHLTQPAVSNALARLREHFDDPLFVRRGRRIAPTPLADSIAGDIADALIALQDSLHRGQQFDPATSNRRFVLSMGDPMEFVALPELVSLLQQQAPGIRLQSQRLARDQLNRQLTSGEVSLAVDIPQVVDQGIRQQFLFRDELCVVMQRNHPLAGPSLSMDQYLQAGHITVSGRSRGTVFEDLALSRQGLERDVKLRGQSYYSACVIAADTELLLTLPRYLARHFQRLLPLATVPVPMPLPPLELVMYWHRSSDNDTAHQWLRQTLWHLIEQRPDDITPSGGK